MRRPPSGPPWPSRATARGLALVSMVVGARGRFAGNGTDARIGFQIHSANALAEWPALLRKGARSFKVDPRWLYGEDKAQADGVDPDASGKQRPGEVFLLSHDPPLPPWDCEGRGYNYTLADLLDAIADPAGPVAAVARADPPLRIALCFKGAPPGGPCAGTVHAQRWLRAVDGFFEAAQARLAQPEQVEFVLDGNGLPLGCLAQRWRPWASVWMNGSAPDAAFASDIPDSEGLDRFQVLNEPARVERWAYYADPHVHYGKFSRPSSPYPYQAWEPAAQATIQGLVDVFVQGPPHAPGLDFATNADVAMLQVYAGVGLNQELPSWSQSQASREANGLVALLRPGLALVLEQQQGEKEQEDQQAVLRAYAFDAQASLSSLRGQELVPLPPRRGMRLPEWSMEEHGPVRTMVALDSGILWVSTEGGRFFVDAVHEEATEAGGGASSVPSLRLELQQVGSLVGVGSGSTAVAVEARRRRWRRLRRTGGRRRGGGRRRRSLSTAVLRQEGGAVAVLELFVPGGGEREEELGCGLAYQIATVPLPGVGLATGPSILQPPGCLWSVEEQGPAVVDAAAAVALESDGGVVVFAAAGGQVLALLLDGQGDADSVSGGTKPCWVQIGVGDHVSAAHLPGRNESVVMLVAGGGFCYNSHLHNTGPVDVCKLHPRRTPGVLDYTYGRAREWAALLREACPASQVAGEAGAGPVKRLISACDAQLLHGSYDLGTRPSLALYPLPGGEVGMLEVHSGFVASCPAEDVPPLGGEGPDAYHWRRACDCGPALPRPGRLVADSFPLRGV